MPADASLLISAVSLALSASVWVKTFWVERRRLRLSIRLLQTKGDTAYMFLMIENKSRLPVAISQITLLQRCGHGYLRTACRPFPKEVISRKKTVKGVITDLPPLYSDQLPISLSGLSSKCCIVLFEDIPKAILPLSTHLTLEILTNRGMRARKKLLLRSGWYDRKYIL